MQDILHADPDANIIVAGDFNDVPMNEGVFRPFDGLLHHAADLANVEPTERYSFVFQMNSQQLDHVLVSPSLASGGIKMEFPHINTWANPSTRVSDHDPVVVGFNVCGRL